jgi:hypothetical protein
MSPNRPGSISQGGDTGSNPVGTTYDDLRKRSSMGVGAALERFRSPRLFPPGHFLAVTAVTYVRAPARPRRARVRRGRYRPASDGDAPRAPRRWWGAELNRDGPPRAAAADLARKLRDFPKADGKPIKPHPVPMPDGTVPRGLLPRGLRDGVGRVSRPRVPPRYDRYTRYRPGQARSASSACSVPPPKRARRSVSRMRSRFGRSRLLRPRERLLEVLREGGTMNLRLYDRRNGAWTSPTPLGDTRLPSLSPAGRTPGTDGAPFGSCLGDARPASPQNARRPCWRPPPCDGGGLGERAGQGPHPSSVPPAIPLEPKMWPQGRTGSSQRSSPAVSLRSKRTGVDVT